MPQMVQANQQNTNLKKEKYVPGLLVYAVHENPPSVSPLCFRGIDFVLGSSALVSAVSCASPVLMCVGSVSATGIG